MSVTAAAAASRMVFATTKQKTYQSKLEEFYPMRTVKYSILLLGLVALIGTVIPSTSWAAGCATCGRSECDVCPKGCGKFRCDCQCDKVCEPKCTTKKVKITCWECVCKKVCMAGKSCGCQGTCDKSRVVKHLIRKTITKEVPIVKCEAVDAGCGCTDGGCDAAGSDSRNGALLETPAAPTPPPLAVKPNGFLRTLFARK